MSDDMRKEDIDENDPDNGVLHDPDFDTGSLMGDGDDESFDDDEPTDDELDDIDADADEEDWDDDDEWTDFEEDDDLDDE